MFFEGLLKLYIHSKEKKGSPCANVIKLATKGDYRERTKKQHDKKRM